MPDLQDLYNQVILDHYRRPRNFYKPERANRQADGLNPFCGDKLTVFLLLEEGILRDISFVGTGCAISIASASVMTETLKGKTEAETKIAFDRFHQLVANSSEVGLVPRPRSSLHVSSALDDASGVGPPLNIPDIPSSVRLAGAAEGSPIYTTNFWDGTLDPSTLGDLGVFSTLREYPVRVKCATLAWKAMRAALEGRQQTASTE